MRFDGARRCCPPIVLTTAGMGTDSREEAPRRLHPTGLVSRIFRQRWCRLPRRPPVQKTGLWLQRVERPVFGLELSQSGVPSDINEVPLKLEIAQGALVQLTEGTK